MVSATTGYGSKWFEQSSSFIPGRKLISGGSFVTGFAATHFILDKVSKETFQEISKFSIIHSKKFLAVSVASFAITLCSQAIGASPLMTTAGYSLSFALFGCLCRANLIVQHLMLFDDDLKRIDLSQIPWRISQLILCKCDLKELNFSQISGHISQLVLRNCDLKGLNFSQIPEHIRILELRGCDLRGINLSQIPPSMHVMGIYECDLRGIDLSQIPENVSILT